MVSAVAYAVMVDHLIESLGLKLLVVDRLRTVGLNICVDFFREDRHTLEDFIPFVQTVDVFADCLLSGKVKNCRAHVFGEIGPVAFLHG